MLNTNLSIDYGIITLTDPHHEFDEKFPNCKAAIKTTFIFTLIIRYRIGAVTTNWWMIETAMAELDNEREICGMINSPCNCRSSVVVSRIRCKICSC